MKNGLYLLGFLACCLSLALAEPVAAGHAEVRLAPLGRSMAPPSLGRKEGWLTISNRDWQDYTVRVEKERVFVTPGGGYRQYGYTGGYGEVTVPSGSTVTLAVEKDTYKVYGTNGEKVNAKVREGRTTTISLEPIGYVGQTGLQAVVNDGDGVRNEMIIDGYQAPVIIEQPPTVVVERPRPVPAPPPVIINRPPVIIGGGRPGNHRPGPPPRPSQDRRPNHKNDGWGFTFSFGSKK
ncbi:MAG: hypothetical protein LUG50_11005 [Planctomycetaceae bacterium]|nr:hypothetical protein [Planctomycetaceae bacterium]